MAFNQIATSITILDSGRIGYQAISLDPIDGSALCVITSGSAVEIAGATFKADGDITPNASSWATISGGTFSSKTVFISLTPSGTAGSQILTAAWTTSPPVWSDSKQGWYASAASNTRIVAYGFKNGTSSCQLKGILKNQKDNIQELIIEIGAWDMDSQASPGLANIYCPYNWGYNHQYIYGFRAIIFDDNVLAGSGDAQAYDLIFPNITSGSPQGMIKLLQNGRIDIQRLVSGTYDSVLFDSSTGNRGYIFINCRIF